MSHSETLQKMLDDRMDLEDVEEAAIQSAIFVLSKDRQRRERIATAALQGLIASAEEGKWEEFAVAAVNCADALIAELDREAKR